MKNLKLKTNIPILIVISFVTCYLILKDSFQDIINIIKDTNYLILLFALIILLLSDYFKGLSFYKIAKSSNTNLSKKEAFKLALETNFFNGITPFSLGGAPFQIYVLKKSHKIDYVNGTNIIYCDYAAYQLTLIIMIVLLFLINLIFGIVETPFIINIFLLIGFIIHLVCLLIVIFIASESKKDDKFVYFVVKILNKIKIIKDVDHTKNRISSLKKLINNYRKNKNLIMWTCFGNFMKLTLFGLIPFICFKAIGMDISIIESLICSIYVWTIAAFIPAPGASGGMEYSFISLFTVVLYETAAKSASFLWRFLSYYLMIVVGAIIFVITNAKIKKSE